jgi:hypothetical protein
VPGLGSTDFQAALAVMAAGMREKSTEFLASGGKVYLPEPTVGAAIHDPGNAGVPAAVQDSTVLPG